MTAAAAAARPRAARRVNAAAVRFVARRLAGLAVTLLVASFLIFGSIHLTPGDPARYMLGPHGVTPQAVAAIHHRYHLDDPLAAQYAHWLSGVVRGDLGDSIQGRQPVWSVLAPRLGVTAELVALAALLTLIGVALGTAAALRPGLVDQSILVTTTVATATPAFVASILLVSLFGVRLGWLPVVGAGDGGLGDRLQHLLLPATALALSLVGLLARVTRASMLEQLGREHVEVARARGIPWARVVRRHVLRNALAPILTVSGTLFAGLLVTTAIVETAFGIHGMGELLVRSVAQKDLPVVQALALLTVTVFVLINLVIDVLLPLLDPRVPLGTEAAT